MKTADHRGVYCAEFKGALVYQAYFTGKTYEYYFDINGKLYARCGATANLRAYWNPYPFTGTPQGKLIGNTTGTQNINAQFTNSFGIEDMYVLVCAFNSPVSGRADSTHLE